MILTSLLGKGRDNLFTASLQTDLEKNHWLVLNDFSWDLPLLEWENLLAAFTALWCDLTLFRMG